MTKHCDLAVIGTGPAGHFGAIQAAKLGKSVVAIERESRLGGVSAITGTIPSKSLREATMHLAGVRQRAFYGMNYRVKRDLTLDDLMRSTDQIIKHETSVFEAQLRRNGVELMRGVASFVGPNQIEINGKNGVTLLEADRILIATGSSPARPPGVDFDGRRVIDSAQILHLKELPKSLIVVGAGVIGVEYACIFGAIGVPVTVINHREQFLEFVDRQIVETLKHHMEMNNIEFRLGEQVDWVESQDDRVVAHTMSEKLIGGDCLLYSVGRCGNTAELGLDLAGVTADERGRLCVNEHLQTQQPNIYAAGDVIGFPALAATSREQGRRAVCHAFEMACEKAKAKNPYGIYAIPEISMIGPTESELTAKSIPYEVGRARYREIARGKILGDTQGMLKLLFERDTLKLLSVHIIGEGATELIHIGQAVEAMGGTIEYFADAVFNYPTLAECYKVAALDGINRVRNLGKIEPRRRAA